LGRNFPHPSRPALWPTPYRAEVKEKIQLYLYLPSVNTWQVTGCILPLSLSISSIINIIIRENDYSITASIGTEKGKIEIENPYNYFSDRRELQKSLKINFLPVHIS
jgi:hypothetical protein